jgi:ribosome biogenesis protein MAK21
MDVLFKITHSSNFNTSIQALMLIQQLATSRRLAEDRFYRTLYESLLDPRLITSSKHALYLNLLFRALKADHNVRRVKAFSKRLTQVITLHQPPFVCGVLYLLKELELTFPGLKSLLQDAEEGGDVDEVFLDVREDSTEGVSLSQSRRTTIVRPDSISGTKTRLSSYDGRRRDPEHSNADKSCLWELVG